MIENKTGVTFPLSALRTEKSPVVGEFSSLMEFADFAKKSGFSVIQLLPVLDTGTQSSPYSSLSAFALHPLYINLSEIEHFKICYDKDATFRRTYDIFLSHKKDERFNYDFATDTKDFLLRRIFALLSNATHPKKFDKMFERLLSFIKENEDWLPYYCVYKHFKQMFRQASWKEWEKTFKKMTKPQILEVWKDKSLEAELYFYAWEQFTAFKQLKIAADYVRNLGITLKGDLPILLNEDSCDVWCCPEVFNQKTRAGSPPDGDNPTGQNWGFPCYDFVSQEKDGFKWWRRRINLASKFFGAYRLDHIPGFFRLWTIGEGEETAEMGHTEPYSAITEAQLVRAGFSTERIRWLSQPHIPTEDFIRLVGNPMATQEILGVLCDKIGREELWLFKSTVKSEADIKKLDLDKYDIDESIQVEIFRRLSWWWKNRTLIEISKNKFIPLWKYGETRAWASLSAEEKSVLSELFSENAIKQEALWQKQAEKIFTALTNESDMVACGEDLGVFIPCMEKVLDEFGIFSLKVIRWNRIWDKPNKPFIDIRTYRKESVVTTSVHDSSTLRENYENEMHSCPIGCRQLTPRIFFGEDPEEADYNPKEKNKFGKDFTPETAKMLLETYAKTSGAWFINPLMDWLYLDSKYYSADAKNERINIPGTVSRFNWTWRMPATVEKLLANGKLQERILKIVKIHNEKLEE